MAVTLMAESLGKPEAAAGKKTLPGMAARAVLDVMRTAMVVFSRLALNGPDWMTRTGRRLAPVLAWWLAHRSRQEARSLSSWSPYNRDIT
jgi:hypothetical protein